MITLKDVGMDLGTAHYGKTFSVGDVERMIKRVKRSGEGKLVFESADLLDQTCLDLSRLGYAVSFGENTVTVRFA